MAGNYRNDNHIFVYGNHIMCGTPSYCQITRSGDGKTMSAQKKTLQLLEKVARVQVEKEFDQGFILCRGFLHQPKRPKSRVKK